MNQDQSTFPKYFKIIDTRCTKDVVDFNKANLTKDYEMVSIGHLLKLSFPLTKTESKPDLLVFAPESPEVKIKVVATIEYVIWNGGSMDPIDINGYISFANKAILREALCTFTEIEAEWAIYDYDYQTKKYFKRFYTLEKPITFQITPNSQAWADDALARLGRSDDPEAQRVSSFYLSLTPKMQVPNQVVGFAFRSNGTLFTRTIGG